MSSPVPWNAQNGDLDSLIEQARKWRAFLETSEGQPWRAAERAQAEQNDWTRSYQGEDQDIRRDQQRSSADYQRALVQNAKAQLAWQMEQGRAQLGLSREDLALRGELGRGDLALRQQTQAQNFQLGQGNLGLGTAQLGASLRGPRDIFAYDRVAAGVSSNPLLQSAVSSWADMTNNRPTGMGSWQGGNPERMTLGALANDFAGWGMGATPGSVSATNGGGKQETLRALDEIARNVHQTAPGWWESLNPTQQQIAMGAWEETGHDVPTVLGRLNASRIRQGIGSTRAA